MHNQTGNAEMVVISRAEYEEFQAQRKKISGLESRVDVLMEALRLARHKQFGASSELWGASGAGKTYFRRNVYMGKFQNGSTEVGLGQGLPLSEGTVALSDKLFERRQAWDFQQPGWEKH